jgi:S-DNA-T family DNA segregation ATPase FtsK/SpoIIIE
LQLNNTDDYSTVVGKTEGMLPEKFKGRGILRRNKDSLFEFQVASVTKSDPPYQVIREFAQRAAVRYADVVAVRVPVLPEKVTEQFLAPHTRQGDLSCLPIGVWKETLEVARYDFAESPVNLVLSVNAEWQNFTDALGLLISNHCAVRTFILAPTGKTQTKLSADKLQVFSDTESCVKIVREIFNIVLTRNNEYKDKLATNELLPQFEPLFVMIQSMSLLKTMLERYRPAKEIIKEADDDTPLNRLQLAMAKCSREYNVYFLVAESLNSLTPFTVENWYKAHISGNDGIWVGSGINTQYRLTVSKKPQGYTTELESDFGFIVSGATAALVKLIQ